MKLFGYECSNKAAVLATTGILAVVLHPLLFDLKSKLHHTTPSFFAISLKVSGPCSENQVTSALFVASTEYIDSHTSSIPCSIDFDFYMDRLLP
jgi:hypothetical protein